MAEEKDLVAEAKKRFERAKDAYGVTRVQAIEDTKFAMGDSDNGWQWPDDIRAARALDKKVCLTVNMTAQHCNQIINNIRQNRPACRVIPQDGGADKKTAEIFAGLIRNIQTASNADDAHDLAAEHAVYGGEGFWRITTEYESPTSFNQVIKVKQCPNPQLVYIDPDCQELDKSDAKWGFVFEDISKEQAVREYGKDVATWQPSKDGWVQEECIRIAEYFYCTYRKDRACLLADGSTVLKSELPEGVQVIEERETDVPEWKWCKLVGGYDEPKEKKDWAGKYLPIVAVVGKELNVNGKIVRKGIVRDLKDPARMVNFSYSEAIQTLALQNKIPYIAAAEAIEGYEDEWKNANTSNKAYLPFNAFDDNANPLPKPERQQPAVMPAAQVQMLQLSTEQMRAASGQQNANFGIKSEAQSGVGIQRLKVQGETATFHFPDNLRRALQYEAKVLIDLIPKINDTQRVMRILGLDGKEEKVMLDPELQGAYQENEGVEGQVEKIFNPTVGLYDVAIDTGPSFQTQRQESFAMLSEMASNAPKIMDVAGDLIIRNSDIQGADQIADRIEKTLPPGLAGKGNQAAQLAQQLQEFQQKDQMHQQVIGKMQEHIEKLEADIKGKVIENEAKVRVAEIQQRTDAAQGVANHGIDVYKAETERMQVLAPAIDPAQIQAIVQQTLQEILGGAPPPQPTQPTEPPQGGFFMGESPPAMDATGAQPGLGVEPNLSEGNPNV
jgi:hypothetical protein